MEPTVLGGLIVGSAAILLVGALWFMTSRAARALFGRYRRLESAIGTQLLGGRLRRGEADRRDYDRAKRTLGA